MNFNASNSSSVSFITHATSLPLEKEWSIARLALGLIIPWFSTRILDTPTSYPPSPPMHPKTLDLEKYGLVRYRCHRSLEDLRAGHGLFSFGRLDNT